MSGFTLVELLVTMTILGGVAMVLTRVLVGQQRFYGSLREIVGVREQMRRATDILPLEIRGASSIGGDIYALSDSAVEFRLTTGVSIICVKTNATTIILPPIDVLQRNTLTTWMVPPQNGDSIFVYSDGSNIGSGDDQWVLQKITAAPAIGTCPTTTGYTKTGDAVNAGTTLTVTSLSAQVIVGAPIRFFRRAKYKLYQTAGGKWYLGFSDCVPGRNPVCSTLEPVAGPYAAYNSATPSLSGIRFLAYDEAGVATTDLTKVARIDITVRREGKQDVFIRGVQGLYKDVMTTSVAIRNRK
jgi:prepilin-type N-terminal cleavage/methylation domain-containing protein